MHANYFFRVNVDADQSLGEQADSALATFETSYVPQHTDENNWWTATAFINDRDEHWDVAARAAATESDLTYDGLVRTATQCVMLDVAHLFDFATVAGKWDMNPLGLGARGADEARIDTLTTAELEQEIMTILPRALARSYEAVPTLDATVDPLGFEHFKRRRMATTFEAFVASEDRPFATGRTPYEYRAHDLGWSSEGDRRGILVVDIHT